MQESAERQEEISRKLQLFSERLKARRHRLGISQETLAENAKVSPRSVVAWESGKTNIPRGMEMSRLAKALGIESSWLLGEEKNNPSVEPHHRRGEPPSVYRLHEDTAGADEATPEKCREHFEKFLAQCDSPSRIGWLWCELLEKFPLNKFKKD
jgi:transcriptional regulator with XRE-family HTH domain